MNQKPQHHSDPLAAFNRHESEVRSYIRAFPAVFDRAQGSHLHSEDGASYIDFFSGAGALNYGHNRAELRDALCNYLAEGGITHSLDMGTKAKREFLEKFHEVVLQPRGMDHKLLFPGPTGTNAVEAALKLARRAKGRSSVWAFRGGFHGMTLGSLAITSNQMKREGAGQEMSDARLVPFENEQLDGQNSLLTLSRMLTAAANAGDLPAALVIETVQCEGGVRVASADWLRSIEQSCKAHGVLLVVDDIQAGCGRTGRFFSFEESGIKPDLVCLSKSLSGFGLPMALVLVKPEYDVLLPGQHNGTFRGNNLAFVTATRALDFWSDPKFERSIQAKSLLLRDRLEEMAADFAETEPEVRGRGLVQGIAFADESMAESVSQECFHRGLIIETAGHQGEVLKFLPALTIDVATLEAGLDIVRQSIGAIAARRPEAAVA